MTPEPQPTRHHREEPRSNGQYAQLVFWRTLAGTPGPRDRGTAEGGQTMNLFHTILAGWVTYSAAVGLLGLALYQVTQHDYTHAWESLMLAFTGFGLRRSSHANLQAIEQKPVVVAPPDRPIVVVSGSEVEPAKPPNLPTAGGRPLP